MRPLTLEDITTNNPNRQCENVALYRQVCSGNSPNLRRLRETDNAFPDKLKGGFDYSDFTSDGWVPGSRSVDFTKFKNFAWFFLKPEILEHLLKQVADHGLSCRRVLEEKPSTISAWFLFSEAKSLVLEDIGTVNYSDLAELISTIKTDNTQRYDENQLQRKEVTFSRGEGLTGAVIHGRQHKATVTVGHLSYQVCPE